MPNDLFEEFGIIRAIRQFCSPWPRWIDSRSFMEGRLRPELPQVMVHVQVAPTEPRALRHVAEDRMHLPLERPRLRCDDLHQRLELREVRREVDRLRPTERLVDF